MQQIKKFKGLVTFIAETNAEDCNVLDCWSLNKKEVLSTKYEQLGISVGQLVDKKNAQYGDSVHKAGDILRILYPEGVKPEQYDDMLLMVRVLDKLSRIANGNQGEENAWQDVCGYGLLGIGV